MSSTLTFQDPLHSVLPHPSCEHVHDVWKILLHRVIPGIAVHILGLLSGWLVPMSPHSTLGDSHAVLLGNSLGLGVELEPCT